MDKPPVAPKTRQEAIRYFSDPDTCLAFMVEQRWPDGRVLCPTCGSDRVTFLSRQRRWKCYAKHPRPQFSIKVGTIFEDSPLGLDKWLPALWMLVNDKNGISSYEVHRALGVTQKTAWFMLHRLRLAMKDGGSRHRRPLATGLRDDYGHAALVLAGARRLHSQRDRQDQDVR
jgi:transposase-like protein